MHISTADLAKFEDYKTRQKTSSTNPISKNQNSQNEGDLPDLINTCVEDIIEKLEEVEFYKVKDKIEKLNIKDNLYLEFLQNTLEILKNIITEKEQYVNLLEGINQAENIEEIGRVLGLALLCDPYLQQVYYSSISLFYVKKCIILNLETNQELCFEMII